MKLSFIKMIWKSFRESAVSMRRRLLVYLLILMFTMLAGVIFLLSVFGVFPTGSGEWGKLFFNEFSRLSEYTSKQFGSASIQAVRMSERLTEAITAVMKQEKLFPSELKNRPELLEPLLKELLPILLLNLYTAEFSGAFVTLDTTVNPNIMGAENSKAGLYIRNNEPNIGGTGTEMRYLLRGTPSLAGSGYVNFQANWDLEFDVRDQLFWLEPLLEYETNPSLPLSRLVYWCSMSPVHGLNESVMVCSVPIIDGAGKALGVCGFEISEMNFMLRHEPNINGFHNTVFMFSSANNGQIRLEDALFSGNNAVYNAFRWQRAMNITGRTGGFSVFSTPGGFSFIGLDKEIRMYPNDSPFAGRKFVAALLVPKADYDAVQNAGNVKFVVILFALTAMGVTASVMLSRRYVKPIMDSLTIARENGVSEKTNIVEIDLLIEKIKKLHPTDSSLPDNLFEDFIARVKTLTQAEMSIFRYYAEGKKLSEITSLMFISMSTLKTHNGHMYAKLGVSSKDELMIYVEMIKRSGMADKIL